MIPAVEGLLPIETLIFELYHGLNGYKKHSIAEIRRELNVHHHTIRRHLDNATFKLNASRILSDRDRKKYEDHLRTTEGFIGDHRHPSLGLIRPTDRVVVVLGNGASISEVTAHDPKAQTPPTDLNFLKVAYDIQRSEYRRLERLFLKVWKNGEPYPMKCQRMEQLFASSYLKVQETIGTSKEGKTAREYFDNLTVLLRNTLSKTTSNIHAMQHLQLFKYLAKANPQSIDIVSFNYDVLADRALVSGDKDNLWRWNYADGYGFKPLRKNYPRDRSTIKLLKMHGSMNWYIPIPGKGRQRVYKTNDPVYIPEPLAAANSPVWQRKQIRQGNRSQYVFPLIIPPVFEKRDLMNKRLQAVWETARDSMSKATLVIVWGYSMPLSDYHSEVLFAQCARKSKHKLVCINPDKEALSRVTCVSGHNWNRWFFRIGHLFNVFEGLNY